MVKHDACLPRPYTSVAASVQVRKVLWALFALVSSPAAAEHVNVEAIQEIIYPLGLATKRAVMIKRFSAEYLSKQVRHPLPGLACCTLLSQAWCGCQQFDGPALVISCPNSSS